MPTVLKFEQPVNPGTLRASKDMALPSFIDNITIRLFARIFGDTDIVIQWSINLAGNLYNNEGYCTSLAAGPVYPPTSVMARVENQLHVLSQQPNHV